MRNATIGDILNLQGINVIDTKVDYYHKKKYWPDWFNEETGRFFHQLNDMSSPTKSFKSTDTFKIQAGYPHEVTKEHKDKILERGIVRDYHSEKKNICIPKLNIIDFEKLIPPNHNNIISFTTPKDSKFIRDITIVDKGSDNNLVFIYVVDRKAQIITAWSEKKTKGKYNIKMSKNIFKSSKYKKC